MPASEKTYDLEQRFNSHAYTHRYTLQPTSNPSLGTSMTTLTGLTASLDAGATYQLHALAGISPSVSGGTLTYQLHAASGLTSTAFRLIVVEIFSGSAPSAGTTTALDSAVTGASIGAGLADRYVTYDAKITVGVAGTISVQAALSSGSAVFYQSASYLDVTQIF